MEVGEGKSDIPERKVNTAPSPTSRPTLVPYWFLMIAYGLSLRVNA